MARIVGGCAPALDYSQEAKKLWAKLGEKEEKDVCLAETFPQPDLNKHQASIPSRWMGRATA